MSFVAFEQRGPIGVLTMNRPEALNALNEQVLRDLDAALDAVAANDEVLVVILTGAGRSFVAGADIGQMKDLTPVQAKKFGSYGNQVFLKLENFPKPVIAAVNGFALGGGCELSMACDIRLASEKAKFGQPEVGLGITPGFGGTQRLARIVGVSNAMELILTAKTINAAQAQELGLVSHVYPPEELMDKAMELAQAIGIELPEEEDRDYDTLGGLVFSQLSVIPEDGSRPVVEALGLRIRVEELCDRRVEWALVERLEPENEHHGEENT